MPSVSAASNLLRALRDEDSLRVENSPITETFSTPLSSPLPTSISQKTVQSASPSVIVTSDNIAVDDVTNSSSGRHSSRHLPHQLDKTAYDAARMSSTAGLGIASPMSDSISPPGANDRTPHHNPQSLHPSGPSSSQQQPSQSSREPLSPCFVHNIFDQGASMRQFLEMNSIPSPGVGADRHPPSATGPSASASNGSTSPGGSDSGRGSSISSDSLPNNQQSAAMAGGLSSGYGKPGVGVARNIDLHRHGQSQSNHADPRGYGSSTDSDLSYSEEEDEGNSLTKQLAETAVGVRELAKQLGRARVRTNIQNVLIVTKARDNRLIKLTRELAIYLMAKRSGGNQRGLTVYVDYQLRKSKRFDAAGIRREHPEFFAPTPRRRSSGGAHGFPGFTDLNGNAAGANPAKEEGQLRYWTSDMCTKNAHLFDFVVTLGGDGTVLFTSWLFQRIVPPVLPFALGSLGFLTNFDFADYADVMDNAIDNGLRVNLRMRFTCTVYRAIAPEEGKGSKAVKKADTGEILMKNLEQGGWEALEGGGSVPIPVSTKKDKEIMCFTTRPVETFEVLNDLVVDRGPSPYVSLLELFGDEHHMTTVQADGLTVSTPTGSTAYSLSAGGSLVHPEIPAMLITPICPHTLSFRPMLLPDTMELRICVPYNSRSTAWASFDGRGRVELKQGDHIKVTASKFPFPTVCADKQSTDWFHAIARTLKWNERERQKSFVVVEEGPARHHKKKSHAAPEEEPAPEPETTETADEPEEEEEDDKFDIDDSSAQAPHAEGDDDEEEGDASSLEGLPVPDPKSSIDLISPSASGTGTPDRYRTSKPQPPPLAPRHLISDAAHKLLDSPGPATARAASQPPSSSSRRLQPPPPVSTSVEQQSPGRQMQMQMRGEDGERDFIRAPESLMQSNRSKIPRDRDVDGDSMRTPRPDSSSNHSHHHHSHHPPRHEARPPASANPEQAAYAHPWFQAQQSARPERNHRRHGSLGSIPATRRAFAAWGRDESDSNASDSDA